MQTRQANYSIVALAIIPSIAFQCFAFFHGNTPFLTPDSPGYMYFGEDRPVGYPLFLTLVKHLSGSFFTVRYVQLGVLSLSFSLLAFAVFRQYHSLKLALLLEAMLFANPGVMMLGNTLMSDCLSAACIALFCACIVRMQSREGIWVWLLCIVTALAFTIRLVNVTLLPAAVLAALLYGRHVRLTVCVLLFCMLCAWALTPMTHWLRQDSTLESEPLARELFQKTLFRDWPEDETANACEGTLIARDTADANAYLQAMPDNLRPLMSHSYSSYLRFMVILPEMAKKHAVTSYAELDPVIMCYTLARIKSDLFYFVKDTTYQFWGLLTYSTFISSSTHDALQHYLKTHPPVLPEPVMRHDKDYGLREKALDDTGLDKNIFSAPDNAFRVPQARPQILVFALRFFQILAALYMAAGMAWLLRRVIVSGRIIGMHFSPLAIIGVAFYMQMVVVAATEMALPRYVFPLWPMMCTAIVMR